MPPKPKFTRDEIVQAALTIVSEKGVEALTAKEPGDALGASARPIFTVFASMKEVQDAVREAAMRRFESYAEQKLPGLPRKDADADPGGYRSGKLSAVLPEVQADVPDLHTGSENRISLSARR